MSDKIKKLSDAIKLGSTFKPQCRAGFSDGVSTCAMGAALEAIGVDFNTDWKPKAVKAFTERWPFLKGMEFCPHCGEGHDSANTTCSLYATIAVLNNDHGWTRESIADWLASKGY